MTAPLLCHLHEDDEPDHWIGAGERVGVLLLDCGVIRHDQHPIPAARACAVRNGVEAERMVEGYEGPWRAA